MALTAKMVASEVLMCGVKFGLRQIPIIGEPAAQVVENLQKRHEASSNAARIAEFEAQLSRVEQGMRDTVEKEIRTILANLGRPAVPGPELTREMTELRQIYDQGWVPNLFEGILSNSTHWEELRRNPKQYGRILGDHDPVDPENGMHLLIDKDSTRILEMPASSLAFLLGNQAMGVPSAEVRVSRDIWAFPSTSAPAQGVITPPIIYPKVQAAVPGPPAPNFRNSLGMTMVRIEPGWFVMGSDEQHWEQPKHEVRITRAFYLGAHPVTQEQYELVMRDNPSYNHRSEYKRSNRPGDLPVESVTWEEAASFCRKLSEREGKEYRLPTEAEWEYACRAGTTTRFFCGNDEDELPRYAWTYADDEKGTKVVGGRKPNPWGLFDMLGNVREFCQDGFDNAYYKSSPRDDPPGTPKDSLRVIRGGGAADSHVTCRSAYRGFTSPESRDRFTGFRVATTGDQ